MSERADITIRHTHLDGTLIEGSAKGDGVWEVVKGYGFRSFRSLGMLGLPQSRDRVAKRWKIDGARKALEAAGFTVAVEIDDTPRDRGTVLADQAERLEERGERLAARADKHAAVSDAARERADHISERFWMGQPILIGHHSERKARRDQDRMHDLTRKAISEGEYAHRLSQRANAAGSALAHSATPGVTARRIETAEAELRDIARKLEGYQRRSLNGRGKVVYTENHEPASGQWRESLLARREQLDGQLAYDREALAAAVAEGRYTQYGPHNVHRGDFVNGAEVVKVNKVSVSCKSGYSWLNKVRFTEITSVRCNHAAPVDAPADPQETTPTADLAPDATCTLVRRSIHTQICEALAELGMPYERETDGGGAYVIDGRNMTPGEAADYLLAGGFAEAFGRAETIVNPDRLQPAAWVEEPADPWAPFVAALGDAR